MLLGRSLSARCAPLRRLSTFSELEASMWQKSASAYANTFDKVTFQAADGLLDAAGVPRMAGKSRAFVMTVAPATMPGIKMAAKPAPAVRSHLTWRWRRFPISQTARRTMHATETPPCLVVRG